MISWTKAALDATPESINFVGIESDNCNNFCTLKEQCHNDFAGLGQLCA